MSFKDIKLIDVGIIVFNDVDFLSFSGPSEVFHATRIGDANLQTNTDFDKSYDSISLFNVKLVSIDKTEYISTSNGIKIIPDLFLDDLMLDKEKYHFEPFIWVIPGGKGIHKVRKDENFIKWLKEAITKAYLSLSVCTGTFAIAQTGHLDVEHATTHWRDFEIFAKEFPQITIDVNARFVETPKVITTGGISCGIDGALKVVARLVSEDAAQRVADDIVYPWLG